MAIRVQMDGSTAQGYDDNDIAELRLVLSVLYIPRSRILTYFFT